MKIFASIIGLILIAMGIVVGLYVGIWLCFIGGFVQIIEALKSPGDINALAIGIGVARILCTSLAGWAAASLFFVPGVALMLDN